MTTPMVSGSEETDEEFRRRLVTFLTDRHPGPAPKDPQDRLAWVKGWLATMYDEGFAGPSWPRELGGMDLPFNKQVVYQEEIARSKVPTFIGTGLAIAGPTIIKYGTEEQKKQLLPPLLRGDSMWVQGYSEPDAGSDLPSLRTTARREGDEYVVRGQKIWTTMAQGADIVFTLVRTGTQESRQHGISYLLIDAHQPGVTIQPIRDMAGGRQFSQITFEDARAPVSNRIGEENQGWPLVRTSLGHERAAGAMNQAAMYRRVVSELIELAHERGTTDDQCVRDALADFEMRVRIMRYSAMRVINDIITTGEPGASASTTRLFNTLFEQDLHEFAVDMLGTYGVIRPGGPSSIQRGRWTRGFLSTRASTIGAGTAEIQRNTVAEKVLGLPYDPAMPTA
ncbi:MAG TPA: acyl-CoA dehydrogenase family protein [Mycobacteriales bacterium]|nr:acyl-CoA dehydrogenase family protein [Mycobacteriales bacterium]